MNMQSNTPANRFPLTGPEDVDKLPFAPELLAAVREQFSEIWESTPHKIGIPHLMEVMDKGMTLSHSFGDPVAIVSIGAEVIRADDMLAIMGSS